MAGQLQNTLAFFEEQAYEIIGFTRVTLGGDAGSLGRTSSGMSIALNQSAKPLKLKVADLGSRIICPIVQKYIDRELMYSDDKTIQGDIRVHAKGVDGLVDNETLSNNILQAMQYLGPVAQQLQQGTPGGQILLGLFTHWAKLNNIPIPGLNNLAMQQAFGQSTGGAYEVSSGSGAGPSAGQMNQPAPNVPPMDGRQQPALNAVAQSNNLPATTARGNNG